MAQSSKGCGGPIEARRQAARRRLATQATQPFVQHDALVQHPCHQRKWGLTCRQAGTLDDQAMPPTSPTWPVWPPPHSRPACAPDSPGGSAGYWCPQSQIRGRPLQEKGHWVGTVICMPHLSTHASTRQCEQGHPDPARQRAKRNQQTALHRTSCFATRSGHIVVHGLIVHGQVWKIGHRCRQLQQAVKCEGVWGRW